MTQTEIPIEVKDYAQSYMDDYSCSDRLRMACKGDEESEEKYLDIMRHGCCGYMDFVKFPHLIDGKEFYFGFNYGH